MNDPIKEEYINKCKNGFYEHEYKKFLERILLQGGPLSTKDKISLTSYINTQNYAYLTPQSIKVLNRFVSNLR